MFRASMIFHNFAPTNSDFDMFFSITFFPDEEFFKTRLTQRKWLAHQNYAEKKMGHRVRLGEIKWPFFLWQA